MIEISIVIPTYNRIERLKNCLHSLIEQNYCKDSYELLVVDDGSDSPVEGIVKGFQRKFKNIRYIYQKHKGVGAARNQGLLNSKGQIIIFVDDDYIVKQDFLEKIKKLFTIYPNIRIAHVKIITEPSMFVRRLAHFSYIVSMRSKLYSINGNMITRIFTRIPKKDNMQIANSLDIGAGCIIKRDVFQDVGLYDENFITGEDSDMFIRLSNAKIDTWYYPEVEITHYYRDTLFLLIKREFTMGKNVKIFNKKWPSRPIFNLANPKDAFFFIASPFALSLQTIVQARSFEEFFIFPLFRFLLQSLYILGYLWGEIKR